MSRLKVAVIGAGIMGISSAYQIKKKFPQFEVTVIAEIFTPNNVSDGAAGLWRPGDVGTTPRKLINKWSKATLDYTNDLLKNDPAASKNGLSYAHGYCISCEEIPAPEWEDLALDLKRFPEKMKGGYGYTGIFTEGKKHIPWLMSNFYNLGGNAIKRKVNDIAELWDQFDIIVNCAGLGAKELAKDNDMFPVRGQVLRVTAPWIKEFVYHVDKDEQGRVCYVFPNQDDVVIGGTKQVNNNDPRIKANVREWILEKTQELIPSLKYAEIKYDWVGLRPSRTQVRLEREVIIRPKSNSRSMKRIAVVHNYGHGANGMTLFWGCANDVVALIEEFVLEQKCLTSKM